MFEVYIPRSRERKEKDTPAIKISKQSIVLNKKARALVSADMLELAYDGATSTIRIKASDGNGGISMKKTKVFAKGFLDHFRVAEIGKFPAEYNESEQALYVKIS